MFTAAHIHIRPLTHLTFLRHHQQSSPHKLITCQAHVMDSKNTVQATFTDGRRTANYPASIWDSKFVDSLKSDYGVLENKMKIIELKDKVSNLFHQADGSLDQLELIDVLQRLGVKYHFEEEIGERLASLEKNFCNNEFSEDNLYITALGFRLLRQKGYKVPQGVFNKFTDQMGRWEQNHCKDVKELLALYEASHVIVEGDYLLDEAKAFTTSQLKDLLSHDMEPLMRKQVERALEVPLHWRVPILEAKWYIEAYMEHKKESTVSPSLLELARLDYNMNQSIYQSNIQTAARWWNKSGLGHKLSFTRDRVVECFIWTVGVVSQPFHGHCREELTKVNSLVTVLDDIYDLYGTMEELQLFTQAIHRWHFEAMEQLPDYMALYYLALFNTANEWAYEIFKDHGVDILPYSRKMWTDLCESYMVEAKWYSMGYRPTLEEYLDNAWVSIAGPLVLMHTYFLMNNGIHKETLENLIRYPDLFRHSSMIFRLADDLATSTDELARGDVPKSIQCYMHEKGVTEEEARLHINELISESWKKMNKELVEGSSLPSQLVDAVFNFARISQSMYQNGDGFVGSSSRTKDKIVSLLVKPL